MIELFAHGTHKLSSKDGMDFGHCAEAFWLGLIVGVVGTILVLCYAIYRRNGNKPTKKPAAAARAKKAPAKKRR